MLELSPVALVDVSEICARNQRCKSRGWCEKVLRSTVHNIRNEQKMSKKYEVCIIR